MKVRVAVDIRTLRRECTCDELFCAGQLPETTSKRQGALTASQEMYTPYTTVAMILNAATHSLTKATSGVSSECRVSGPLECPLMGNGSSHRSDQSV
jgi:hypothetical protein